MKSSTSHYWSFLFCCLLFLAVGISACSNAGNITGPGSQISAGNGRLVFNGANASVILTDSAGSFMQTVGSGYVQSAGTGVFVRLTTGSTGNGTSIVVSNDAATDSLILFRTTTDLLSAYPIMSRDGSHLVVPLRDSIPGMRKLLIYKLTNSSGNITCSDSSVATSTMTKYTLPCFSPDGSKIAFFVGASSAASLSITNVDGSGLQTVATNVNCGDSYLGTIDWSSSGNKLAFFDGNLIRIVNSDGSEPALIDSGVNPRWSPDGKTLAYSRDGQIIITSDMGATKKSLTNPNTLFGWPDWSPDGTKIVCTSPDYSVLNSPFPSIVVVNVATGASKTISTNGAVAVWLY